MTNGFPMGEGMRVGILNAFPPGEIRWDIDPMSLYVDFLKAGSKGIETTVYDVAAGVFPAATDECDAYLITGSPRGTYDSDPWIAELTTFLKRAYAASVKLVGICFGHQMLAHALGGKSEKSAKGYRLGLFPFETRAETASDTCSLYFAHRDQVVDLSPGAELLGGNAFCPNGMFGIGDRVLAMQGHPEFSRSVMKQIIEAVKPSVDPSVVATAIETIGRGEPDAHVAARWVGDFLNPSRASLRSP